MRGGRVREVEVRGGNSKGREVVRGGRVRGGKW